MESGPRARFWGFLAGAAAIELRRLDVASRLMKCLQDWTAG
jgi:hypothetical protein